MSTPITIARLYRPVPEIALGDNVAAELLARGNIVLVSKKIWAKRDPVLVRALARLEGKLPVVNYTTQPLPNTQLSRVMRKHVIIPPVKRKPPSRVGRLCGYNIKAK